jgi:flagellar hook-associated protein 3 FlgL
MRVAFNTLADSLVNQLATLNTQQNELQTQVATGLRFSQLDDDPSAMGTVLDLQAQNSQTAQYQQNITSLQEVATSSYNSMQTLDTISQRASEIATLAGGTASPQQLQTYASEVTQLIQQGVQAMNSQDQGQYLFGGTLDNQPPFVAATDASGNVTAVTYQGNSSVASVEIAPGNTLSAQTVGANTSGSGPEGLITDSRNGADFFNHLIALQNHLLAGNTTAISSTDSAALAKDQDNITLQVGMNGVIQSHLAAASAVATTQANSLNSLMSQDAGADPAKTMTELSAAQSAYQAAVQSGASLLNENLSLAYYLA